MHRMELYTERLLLRPFRMTDLNALAPILSDPEVMAFIGDGPLAPHAMVQQLEHWISDYQRDGFGFMAFIDRSTGNLIGYGGFLHQVVEGETKIELGYVVAKPYWRQGFAFEAASALKNHGLISLKMPELISIIHEANIPSQQMASKLGMTVAKEVRIDEQRCLIYHCL